MNFPSHFQHIFEQLNHQRLHAQLCDCVVVVGGQTFQAHRSILAACSSHFRALLSSKVVTPEAFSTLLDMIYTSTLSLGASNVMDVLLAASHLHLNTVVKACKIHLSRKNFPASPPKGWRPVEQQQQQQSPSSQAAGSSQQNNSLAGFLSSVRPPLDVGATVVQSTRAGKRSGATTFRRIAPKAQPGSEAGTEPPLGSGDAADRPPLTRASEDVLSKCKKAAAEDHVLLVEGEKKYACKICCKTFMNLTDCKKHIRVHTGEKPYPCPKCGKRFSHRHEVLAEKVQVRKYMMSNIAFKNGRDEFPCGRQHYSVFY
uniref:Zinc finger and BTB domain containing 5 n=1 Tax=Amphilophus citrinellus TaxID=61819 RepID=A0A3Q0SI31_AMPCI